MNGVEAITRAKEAWKIRELLESCQSCHCDAPHYECCVYEDPSLKPEDRCCGESRDATACCYYHPLPSPTVVRALIPVFMALLDMWEANEKLCKISHSFDTKPMDEVKK